MESLPDGAWQYVLGYITIGTSADVDWNALLRVSRAVNEHMSHCESAWVARLIHDKVLDGSECDMAVLRRLRHESPAGESMVVFYRHARAICALQYYHLSWTGEGQPAIPLPPWYSLAQCMSRNGAMLCVSNWRLADDILAICHAIHRITCYHGDNDIFSKQPPLAICCGVLATIAAKVQCQLDCYRIHRPLHAVVVLRRNTSFKKGSIPLRIEPCPYIVPDAVIYWQQQQQHPQQCYWAKSILPAIELAVCNQLLQQSSTTPSFLNGNVEFIYIGYDVCNKTIMLHFFDNMRRASDIVLRAII